MMSHVILYCVFCPLVCSFEFVQLHTILYCILQMALTILNGDYFATIHCICHILMYCNAGYYDMLHYTMYVTHCFDF